MCKRQLTAEFQQQYADRAGMEGTISQGVRAFGMRRSRDLARTHLQQVLIATAMNLVRVAWLTESRSMKPRASPFVGLVAPA
jgi:transposase